MSDTFEGKVVFITGVARGQGRSHAVRFAREGANIVGLDLCGQIGTVDYGMSTRADLDETVKLVEAVGGNIVARVGDVRDRASIASVYEEGLDRFGRIDHVVANAGIMPIWGPHSDTMEAWTDCLDVLLTGVLNTIEVCYPQLIHQGDGGSIVIIGSMAGVQPMMRTLDGRTLGLLGYCAAKAALVSLAQNYASILAGQNIRVNVVNPTGVDTPMIDNEVSRRRFDSANEEDLKTLVSAIPVRTLSVDDVSSAVMWLCSPHSRFYTGNSMLLDAGAHLR